MANASLPILTVVHHPLLRRELTIIRDKSTLHENFRSAVKRISTLLAVEITRHVELTDIRVDTPLEQTEGYLLKSKVILAPVLRAGLGMVSGFLAVIPDAKVGHIGIQRDEINLMPVVYYSKAPMSDNDSMVILLDPMLATGGSSVAAVNYLKSRGTQNIFFACLVAAPEGVEHFHSSHPDVPVFAASYDRCLNERGYILPGLGDAGDRMFGTI